MIVDERFDYPIDHHLDLVRRTPQWGFGMYSESVYYRTYSRQMSDGLQEQWADTVVRTVKGAFSILKWRHKVEGLPFDDAFWGYYAKGMADFIFDFKLLPPGRGLWAGGTDHIYTVGNAALNNCGYVDVTTLSADAAWAMDQLMLGVGVGFSNDHWNRILVEPDPEYTLTYTIPDSREGWVESTELLIRSYEQLGDFPTILFDYSQIRPEGTPIRGFGGEASGPGPLMALHERLRTLLSAYARGRVPDWYDPNGWTRYTPSMLVTDVINLIGKCVVAGNVRRSAEIALGSITDPVHRTLKRPDAFPARNDWSSGWGHLSNNSVVLRDDTDFDLLPNIIPGIIANGEPGFINLQAIQKFGRIGRHKEDRATGCNPCGEIPLESYELCNLVEVFPTRCRTEAEYYQALEYATMYATIIALLPSHDERTNRVVDRNHRIGVSLSGLADWKDQIGVLRQTRLMRDGYKLVEHRNCQLLRMFGLAPSVRLTTVKPSGTISQLAGVSSGMHHPWARWTLRRVRVGRTRPIADVLIKAGIPHEPEIKDPDGTLVFEFPIEYSEGKTRPQSEVSMWEQFADVARYQRDWADNMVSATITFQPSEEHQIGHAVATHAPIVKSISMLPDFDAYHGPAVYGQMPNEQITRDEYRRRRKEIDRIDWSRFSGSDGEDSKYCAGDACEVDI